MTFLCQWLEPAPPQAEVGQPVSVEACDADGEPLVGIEVELCGPAGVLRPLGASDADGVVRFVPDQVGSYRIQARHGGVLLLAPFHAVEPPRRWLYGLAGVPLGLLLLWWNVRSIRRDRVRAARA